MASPVRVLGELLNDLHVELLGAQTIDAVGRMVLQMRCLVGDRSGLFCLEDRLLLILRIFSLVRRDGVHVGVQDGDSLGDRTPHVSPINRL